MTQIVVCVKQHISYEGNYKNKHVLQKHKTWNNCLQLEKKKTKKKVSLNLQFSKLW